MQSRPVLGARELRLGGLLPHTCGAYEPGPCSACRLLLPDNTCTLEWIERHPDGGTLEDISQVFDLTRERIRQIEASALVKLHRALERDDTTAPMGHRKDVR